VATDYDDMARVYEQHAADSAYNAHYDRPAVLELVGDVARQRVLDAGCGPGLYSEELLARGADLVAIDASEAMVELARKRLGTRARVLRSDLSEPLPFADAAFDLVVCALVIHHVADRAACLREFFRVLTPGGHVVLSTQHPTTDWLRKGGSYFETKEEEDTWHRGDRAYAVRFWREPLTAFCVAIAEAGFLIERLVEPLPAPTMRESAPEHWEKLQREPGFLILRLVKS
jgi:2-polyprenyl-3-methyl-5-hydroxy-6-metoxy-1,4-benzoquinol methylase